MYHSPDYKKIRKIYLVILRTPIYVKALRQNAVLPWSKVNTTEPKSGINALFYGLTLLYFCFS